MTARLEKQRRDWDLRLDRMKEKARTLRESSTANQSSKGPQAGTTVALGDKVSQLCVNFVFSRSLQSSSFLVKKCSYNMLVREWALEGTIRFCGTFFFLPF